MTYPAFPTRPHAATPSRTLSQLLSDRRPALSAPHDIDHDGLRRSPFEIDGDKISFTEGFRALADKTQVHDRVRHGGHHRNRLTHSVEVSRVGRSLGTAVGARMIAYHGLYAGTSPEVFWDVDPREIGHLVAAAAMSHDIGNPPFGHDGESVISEFFQTDPDGIALASLTHDTIAAELRQHEGNAQGFRMLTRSMGWRQAGGINLTSATLAAFGKYPFALTPGIRKYGIHRADLATMERVATDCALQADPETGGWRRHPAAWLLEAADDISYLTVDFEDSAFLGIVPVDDLVDLFAPIVGPTAISDAARLAPAERIQFLRSRMIKELIASVTHVYPDLAAAMDQGTLGSTLHGGGVLAHTPHAAALARIRTYSRDRIYRSDETRAARDGFRLSFGRVLKRLAAELRDQLSCGDITAPDPARHAFLARLPFMSLDRQVPADPDAAVPWLLDRITLMSDAHVMALDRDITDEA